VTSHRSPRPVPAIRERVHRGCRIEITVLRNKGAGRRGGRAGGAAWL